MLIFIDMLILSLTCMNSVYYIYFILYFTWTVCLNTTLVTSPPQYGSTQSLTSCMDKLNGVRGNKMFKVMLIFQSEPHFILLTFSLYHGHYADSLQSCISHTHTYTYTQSQYSYPCGDHLLT